MHSDEHPARTIIENWVDLLNARRPGTRPPASCIDGLIAATRLERERAERAEKSNLAKGEAPAPVDLTIADTIRFVTEAVQAIEDEVRMACGFSPYRRATSDVMVPAICHDLQVWGGLLGEGWPTWIAQQLAPAAKGVRRALGELYRPVTIAQPCPWCGGPLTVYAYTTDDLGPHVLCSGERECQASTLTRLHGRPMWTWDELPRLGAKLTVVLTKRPPRKPFVDAHELKLRAATSAA